jgi:hypothetical protein
MPDMLVRLYDLPDLGTAIAEQQSQDIEVRRALAPEKHGVLPARLRERRAAIR